MPQTQSPVITHPNKPPCSPSFTGCPQMEEGGMITKWKDPGSPVTVLKHSGAETPTPYLTFLKTPRGRDIPSAVLTKLSVTTALYR